MTTNQVLIKDAADATPKQISFATHATYAPGTNNVIEIGTPIEVEMSLLDLADGAAVQSTKADFGAVRASRYVVTCCLEYQVVAPTTGTLVEFYWAASGQATAANGNPGYVTGADGAYTGTPATLAEGIAQLLYRYFRSFRRSGISDRGCRCVFSDPSLWQFDSEKRNGSEDRRYGYYRNCGGADPDS
ncbi:hypothetical protein LCGC14_2245820 [marine sediment metagenome]|uniref:Uncharacterized protein n=1 Tax=marine sediment metagenome TaxID=412755 RepID=A0A0F9FGM3_9ZZZZ